MPQFPFDQPKYERHAKALWAYVNELKPYLWKKGETSGNTLQVIAMTVDCDGDALVKFSNKQQVYLMMLIAKLIVRPNVQYFCLVQNRSIVSVVILRLHYLCHFLPCRYKLQLFCQSNYF